MIRARDAIFDEDQIFDGNLEILQDNGLDIDLNDLSAPVTQLDVCQKYDYVLALFGCQNEFVTTAVPSRYWG